MKFLSKIFAGGAGDLIEKVGNVADKFITTSAEKEQLKQELIKIVNEHEEKMAAQITEQMKSEDAAVTERWKADMGSDSWLSKNTRPLVMLSLVAFTFLIILNDSMAYFNFDVKEAYIELLQMLLMTTVVAYFGSRGVEKVQSMKKTNGS